MKRDTELIIVATLFVLLFGLVSRLVVVRQGGLTEEAQGSWACTTDTHTCPDGSEVGRVPPYCLFAACPSGE